MPTYALTDNEKTVTVEHVCGIAVRNATIVEVSRHYGLTIQTCEPADPQSKGGSEATVKIAKADLVPTDHNLREQYADWQALEPACQEFMADVNTRPHRATRQPPVMLLAQEHEHLHRLPRLPHTLCFGQTRKVDRQATVSVGDAIYSVPHELIGERVWVRAEGEQLVVVHIDRDAGAAGGRPAPADHAGPPEHPGRALPARPAGALERKPRARNSEEREFLAIGEGAERWLKRAAAEGTQRIRRKMAEAIDLAKLHGTGPVNDALAAVRELWPVRRRGPGQHPRPPAVRDRDPAARARSQRTARCRPRPAAGRSSGDDRQPPAPPPLPDELDRLLRRLRMPYVGGRRRK